MRTHEIQSNSLKRRRHSLMLLSAVALAIGTLTVPAPAGELLGGLGGKVGGAVGGLGRAVGGALDGGGSTGGTGGVGGLGGRGGKVGGAVSASVGGVSGRVNGAIGHSLSLGTLSTRARVKLLGPKGLATATVRSRLLGGIHTKVYVLSHRNLVKVCLGVGGGSGCGSGHRSQLLNLIDTRLAVLSNDRLLGLCLSVGGAGCGRLASGGGGGGGGGGNGGGGNGSGNHGDNGRDDIIFASLSSGDKRLLALNCRNVLERPAKFDRDMAAVCRLLKM